MSAIEKRAFLMKIHTARAYRELSLSAKPYSVSVYAKLQTWSEQDSCHADLLYDTALEGEVSAGSAVPHPFTLKYEEDPTDAKQAMSVIVSIMTDVISAEAMSAAVFQASGRHEAFASVSRERLQEAQRIVGYAKNGGIYTASQAIRWQCSKCGFVVTDFDTPEKCPCCEGKRAAFVRSVEIGE